MSDKHILSEDEVDALWGSRTSIIQFARAIETVVRLRIEFEADGKALSDKQPLREQYARDGDAKCAQPTQEDLEAFIRRAGFTYGWENLESWARQMAQQAVSELAAAQASAEAIRNAALEEAAKVCDKSSLQPAIAARIRALKSAPAGQDSSRCWCRTCRPITLTDMRMVLCPDCGNKRCPHANDHRNACTGSNEPGQPGSAYPAALAPAKDADVALPPLPQLIRAHLNASEFARQSLKYTADFVAIVLRDYGRACYEAGRQQCGGEVDERAAFENRFPSARNDLVTHGVYLHQRNQDRWEAWQARAALAATKGESNG